MNTGQRQEDPRVYIPHNPGPHRIYSLTADARFFIEINPLNILDTVSHTNNLLVSYVY